jgi:hypothetical protein
VRSDAACGSKFPRPTSSIDGEDQDFEDLGLIASRKASGCDASKDSEREPGQHGRPMVPMHGSGGESEFQHLSGCCRARPEPAETGVRPALGSRGSQGPPPSCGIRYSGVRSPMRRREVVPRWRSARPHRHSRHRARTTPCRELPGTLRSPNGPLRQARGTPEFRSLR